MVAGGLEPILTHGICKQSSSSNSMSSSSSSSGSSSSSSSSGSSSSFCWRERSMLTHGWVMQSIYNTCKTSHQMMTHIIYLASLNIWITELYAF